MMIGGGAYGTFPPPSPDGKRSMDKAKKKTEREMEEPMGDVAAGGR